MIPNRTKERTNTSSQQFTLTDLTIDASGPSPENDDECIHRQLQYLQRMIASTIQQGPAITSEGLQSFLTGDVQTIVKSIAHRCEELGKQHQEYLKRLSDYGWFLSPDMPLAHLRLFANALEATASFEHSAIRSYFQQRMDSIENELIEAYPRRSQVLHDAFWAHRASKYTLSVPVFLSQADGIWRDQFCKNFFLGQKRKDTLQHCKNDPQLQYIVAMLTLLEPREGNNNHLWATEAERDSSSSALNRHQVLHGESVDYATEQNSFKALSLLVCFRGICQRVAQ